MGQRRGDGAGFLVPDVVPPLKAMVKDSCVYTDSDEIGAVKVPKEHHAAVAAHQFRGWCLRFVLRDGYFAIVLVNPLVIIRLL